MSNVLEIAASLQSQTKYRIRTLSLSLKSIGIIKSVDQLSSTDALVELTTELDSVKSQDCQVPPSENYFWNSAVVDLILVAEVWPSDKLSKHILAWVKTITQENNTITH